jgi:hypothetical protein
MAPNCIQYGCSVFKTFIFLFVELQWASLVLIDCKCQAKDKHSSPFLPFLSQEEKSVVNMAQDCNIFKTVILFVELQRASLVLIDW